MAAVLLIAEAGGVVSGAYGNPFPSLRALTDATTTIAARNPALHRAILHVARATPFGNA